MAESHSAPEPHDGTDELAYALVTPYSLHKSRTGGILARLLWANVKLVAARMYAPQPGSGFIRKYCDAIYDPDEEEIPLRYQNLLIRYVVENFGKPNTRGISNRLMLLVFRGPNAIEGISEAVGHITQDVRGDNVRGTFGDYIHEEPANVPESPAYQQKKRLMDRYPELNDVDLPTQKGTFFEPGVLTGSTAKVTEKHLKLFRDHAYRDGGFVLEALDRVNPHEMESSLVILKPESFRHRNPLPGNLIDFFARAGMFMTATKLLHLSVDEAREFYSAKLPQFRQQLKDNVGEEARRAVRKARQLADHIAQNMDASEEVARDPAKAIELVREVDELYNSRSEPGKLKKPVADRMFSELAERLTDLEPDDAFYRELTEELKELNAQTEFKELIKYMTGRDPETGKNVNPEEETVCLALLYSGENALERIRKRLKELREVYGQNALQNRAHASDPDEDPLKEMKVVGMPNTEEGRKTTCDVEQVVTEFFGE
ncbi:MAG: hypothetical protein V5A84_01570 [Planctomycetota bacterium]